MRARSFPSLLLVLLTAALPLCPAARASEKHGAVVATDPSDVTPHVLDGEVRAIAPVGPLIVVGGSFTAVRETGDGGGRTVSRRNLFAFDAATGTVDEDFRPAIDGRVEALASDGEGGVFVGGRFRLGSMRHLAKIDLATGAPVEAFAARIDGHSVQDLSRHEHRVYVGGSFSSAGGARRENLAALDPATGDADPAVALPFSRPRQGRARIEKLDVTGDGSVLVAVGNFTRVAHRERQQLAVIDLGSGSARLAEWRTDRYADSCSSAWDTYMTDVDIAPDSSYFVVVTAGARAHPTLCDATARWELTARGTDLQPTWVDYSGGDTLTAVATTGAAIYVGGHQRWMNNPFPRGTAADARPGPGAVARSGIAALDPVNGLPLSWNPGRRERGAGVFALVPASDGLWIGSDTEHLGGEDHGRLAFAPLAGGSQPWRAEAPSLPGELYRVGSDGSVVRRWFDGSEVGPADRLESRSVLADVRGAFMTGGTVYVGRDDGRVQALPFDGATFGTAETLDLRGLGRRHFPVEELTGLFFLDGRLYYTLEGDRRLRYRHFSPESRIIGALEFVASGERDGLDWSETAGLAYASGGLYYSGPSAALHRIDFVDGGPVPGTEAVAVPADAAGSGGWPSRGTFVFAG